MPREGYWKDKEVLPQHAKRRRDWYQSNPEFAEAERARQRRNDQSKRKRKFGNPARVALQSGLGEDRYTPSTLSVLMGRAPRYVTHLIAKSQFPPSAEVSQDGDMLYPREQAEALLRIYADHVDNVASNYGMDHHNTRAALFVTLGVKN